MVIGLRLRRSLCYAFLFPLVLVVPAYALVMPPHPFATTDRHALLTTDAAGAVTGIQARVRAPAERSARRVSRAASRSGSASSRATGWPPGPLTCRRRWC